MSSPQDISLNGIQFLWKYWPNTRVVATLLFFVATTAFIFFYGWIVGKPRIIGKGPLKEKLMKTCPILKQRYWPTFWALQCHLSTILRVFLQSHPNIRYLRDILTLHDGGEVALDWGSNKDLSQSLSSPERRDLPVLLVIPGISGCSQSAYVKHLVQDGLIAGYRPIVFNQRGNGGIRLKTRRTYCASNVEDLVEVVQYIQAQYPTCPIVGIGVSLGGIILVQYLHQLGKNCDLTAVISCSASWDPFKTRDSIEKKLSNRMLYSRVLANNLKEMVRSNTSELSAEEQEKLPLNLVAIEKASLISDIDIHLTVPIFGYSSLDDYYNASCNKDKVHKIRTPLVSIAAADDPFVPRESLPIEEFESNPHTVMVLTSCGGHFGFLEGIYPSDKTWMNRTVRQLLEAFKTVL